VFSGGTHFDNTGYLYIVKLELYQEIALFAKPPASHFSLCDLLLSLYLRDDVW